MGTSETHNGVVVGGYALFLQLAERPGECSQLGGSSGVSVLRQPVLGDIVL